MAKIQDCPGFEPFGADVKAARKQMRLSRQNPPSLLLIERIRTTKLLNENRQFPEKYKK